MKLVLTCFGNADIKAQKFFTKTENVVKLDSNEQEFVSDLVENFYQLNIWIWYHFDSKVQVLTLYQDRTCRCMQIDGSSIYQTIISTNISYFTDFEDYFSRMLFEYLLEDYSVNNNQIIDLNIIIRIAGMVSFITKQAHVLQNKMVLRKE